MGYDIQPCLDSVVYHRGGHSTSKKGMSFVAYHLTRSMFLYVIKFYPERVLFVLIYTIARAVFSSFKGNFSVAIARMKGMYDALTNQGKK